MNREQFMHVIRAAVDIVDDELVVVGSQAILASIEDPPVAMIRSTEVDLYPRTEPERAAEVDGSIGEGSRFHDTYGYYAHGVGPETIVAPAGWEGRLVRFAIAPFKKKSGDAVGWCLSVEDLMLAKLAAGRPHDLEFVEAALRGGLVTPDELLRGAPLMPRPVRSMVRQRIDGLAATITRSG